MSSDTDSLVMVNVVTGEQTLVGSLSNTGGYTDPAVMARGSEGKLFVWNISPYKDRGLSELDPSTGLATLVSETSNLILSGLALSDDNLVGSEGYIFFVPYISDGAQRPQPPAEGLFLLDPLDGATCRLDIFQGNSLASQLSWVPERCME